jgi:hypothetical protein
MPSEQDHLTQAEHNKELIAFLGNGSSLYPDWIVTIAFYITIHLLEAYFSKKQNKHSDNYQIRQDNFFSDFKELRQIYNNYSELKTLSNESRYQCLFSKWTSIQVQNALGHLHRIEQHLNSLP